jgi:hypothetical protein
MIIILMGYGLAKIPMNGFRLASLDAKLKFLQFKVADYDG